MEPMLKANSATVNGFYFDYYNPDFGVKCYSDVMMKHYKAGFLEMLTLSKTPTYNCFLPGTVVSGPVPMPIESGPELVGGHQGALLQAKPLQRNYEGPVLSIRPRCGLVLNVTPQHRFLAIKRKHDLRSREGRYELHQKRGFRPEWLRADQLAPGDILMSTEVSTGTNGSARLRLKNHRSRSRLAYRSVHWGR